MNCYGCHSMDVLPIPGFVCDFCSRHVTWADVNHFHATMVAPRADIEADLLDLAERGVT